MEENIKNEVQIKEKRVGSFTFGISLILFGICIIIQTFTKIDVLKYLLMLWPIIFIILGIEVLYFASKKNVKIKYDILSIIMVLFILLFAGIFSFVNYGVNKILYDQNFKSYILSDVSNSQFTYFFESNKLSIVNSSSNKVKYNIIQDSDLHDEIKVSINVDYNQKYIENAFGLFFNRNWIERNIDKDYDNGKITISNVPEYIDSININVYAKDTSKVEYKDLTNK